MKAKFMKVAFIVAIAMVGGINVFNAQKSVELSDIALANVEALANGESNSTITGECWKSYVVVTECHVTCGCGTVWYPEQRQPNSVARNVSGKCGECGNTVWTSYQ